MSDTILTTVDNQRYHKLFISLRYWLLGMSHNDPSYRVALEALEYAKNIHTGFRKDGATPEFQHQLEIAQYLRTLLPFLEHPAEILATTFLHDAPEDYDISFNEIEQKFGILVKNAVELLTKEYKGNKKNLDELFHKMGENSIASIVKGGDRIHNLQSMIGVFTIEKQKIYLLETEKYIVPMLKNARRNFIFQEAAYENIKSFINVQLKIYKGMHHQIDSVSGKSHTKDKEIDDK